MTNRIGAWPIYIVIFTNLITLMPVLVNLGYFRSDISAIKQTFEENFADVNEFLDQYSQIDTE